MLQLTSGCGQFATSNRHPLNNVADNFSESDSVMLQTDITILEQRQKALEKEIGEALLHAPIDDPMIAYLKSRILFVKEEIDRLRHQAFISYHAARAAAYFRHNARGHSIRGSIRSAVRQSYFAKVTQAGVA
jgi:hypothetical protein